MPYYTLGNLTSKLGIYNLILKDINCMPVPGIPTLFWTRVKIFFILKRLISIINAIDFPLKTSIESFRNVKICQKRRKKYT